MKKLVQFGDLTPADFAEHEVWTSCHSFDHDEPWFDDTDEETFRPWSGPTPVAPEEGMFLVKANFVLADGTRLDGCVTPAHDLASPNDLGTLQPQIFLPGGERLGFRPGMFGQAEPIAAHCRALGRDATSVFPIRFFAQDNLASAVTTGSIEGFYTVPDGRQVHVSR